MTDNQCPFHNKSLASTESEKVWSSPDAKHFGKAVHPERVLSYPIKVDIVLYKTAFNVNFLLVHCNCGSIRTEHMKTPLPTVFVREKANGGH